MLFVANACLRGCLKVDSGRNGAVCCKPESAGSDANLRRTGCMHTVRTCHGRCCLGQFGQPASIAPMSDAPTPRRGRSGATMPMAGLADDHRDRRPVVVASSPRKKKSGLKPPSRPRKPKYKTTTWREVKIEVFHDGEWKPAKIVDGQVPQFLPRVTFTILLESGEQLERFRDSRMRRVA